MNARAKRGSAAGRGRQAQKAATREALKAAARSCLVERGYRATQIGHITDAARVAKGTFYVHFESLDALCEELLAEFNAGLVERLRPLAAGRPRGDLRAAVRRVAEIVLTYWDEERGFVRAYAEKSALGIDLERLQFGVNPPMQAFLHATLEELAATAGTRLRHPELIVQGVLAMWLRLGLQALFNPAVRRADVIDVLADMTVGVLNAAVADGRAIRKRSGEKR